MKQVFIVRSDLKMGKGKIAAQVAHAAIECYKKASSDEIRKWEDEGSKKVVLKVKDLEDLMHYHRICTSKKIKCSLIRDAGHTQVEPGSVTVLGIGPVDDNIIEPITGNLKMI